MSLRGHSKDASHVHFDAAQLSKDHDSEITVEVVGPDDRIIHLGFLKLHHQYQLDFEVSDTLGNGIDANAEHDEHVSVSNIGHSENGSGHRLTVTLRAYKDKLLREHIVLTNKTSGKSVTLTLLARVLGKHKGTPSLKTGIRRINAGPDRDSSDDSDDVDP